MEFFRLNFEDENYAGFVFVYSICRVYLMHRVYSGKIGFILPRKRKRRNADHARYSRMYAVVASDVISQVICFFLFPFGYNLFTYFV